MVSFVTALRKFAEYCDYGAILNDMLRDRIVCGIPANECNKGYCRRLG